MAVTTPRTRANIVTEVCDFLREAEVGRFLLSGFARTHPAVEESIRRELLAQASDGYAGAGAAIRDLAAFNRLGQIGQRTLVVGGNRHVSTPYPEHGRRIAEAMPHAEVAHLDTGHIAHVEAPAALAAMLRRFLLPRPEIDVAADTLFDAGLVNRRRLLGDAWIDRALANRTPFNAEFQAMITRTAWHEIWGRPGLDDTTRRLLVVVLTAALGR